MSKNLFAIFSPQSKKASKKFKKKSKKNCRLVSDAATISLKIQINFAITSAILFLNYAPTAAPE